MYARLANGTRNSADTDKYRKIQNLQVVFDNGLPQFTSATPDQFYDVSKRNMYKYLVPLLNNFNWILIMKWIIKRYTVVVLLLVIDPALDLGIRPSDTTGSGGRFIFQVQNSIFC